jgi:hypothetical protein
MAETFAETLPIETPKLALLESMVACRDSKHNSRI